MDQRGRKSSSKLTVLPGGEDKRPPAPKELSEREAEIWDAVIATKPADWFDDDTYPLLKDYCRHIVRQDKLSRLINEYSPDGDSEKAIGALDQLLKMSERETRLIATLATKMRLSQQSKYGARGAESAARRGRQKAKPWNFE